MRYNYNDELMSSPLSLYNESVIFPSNLTLNYSIGPSTNTMASSSLLKLTLLAAVVLLCAANVMGAAGTGSRVQVECLCQVRD